jgi:hypothetical protein
MEKRKWNPKKNLRTFDKIEDITFVVDTEFCENNIQCIVPNVDTKKELFYLENVLSDQECDNLIQQSETKYSSLQEEFLPEERQGNRLLTKNPLLADILFQRIQQHISPLLLLSSNITPCGFGTDGTWVMKQINSCFRFNQYIAPSIGFTPHRDATFIENEDIRSILSILIYLNDDFDGGDTVFYNTLGERQKYDLVEDEMKKGFVERYRYRPKKGSVLIFNHNMIHEGTSISHGIKYVIRSDIVFQRTNRPETYNEEWKRNPDFLEAIHYFRQAIQYELDGDLKKASLYYQKELALRQYQCQYQNQLK